jgi:hypothetical protein
MSGAVSDVVQEVRARVWTGGISPQDESTELRHIGEDILAREKNSTEFRFDAEPLLPVAEHIALHISGFGLLQPLLEDPEVEEICGFIGNQRAYPEALILPEYIPEGGEAMGDMDMNEIDPMFVDSARIVVISQQGSASLLQRKLKLGYNRAGRIVDQLEGMGIIGAFQGSKAREVLFSDIEALDEFLKVKGLL